MGSRFARLAAFAAVVAVAGAGLASPAGAVAGGSPVPEGRYGFAVRLAMTGVPRPDGSRSGSFCSAALLSPWWVITAGHCFHDRERNPVSGAVPYETTATIGRADLAHRGGYVVPLVTVRQAPQGDVALAKLARPVYDIQPLRVADDAPEAGDVLRIAGWGKLTAADPAPATHLRTGQFRVSSVAPATIGLRGYRPAADTSACAYDSGAPYFAERRRPVLVSVESTGPDCPHEQEETTSRVDPLRGWIRGTLLT